MVLFLIFILTKIVAVQEKQCLLLRLFSLSHCIGKSCCEREPEITFTESYKLRARID